MSESPETPSAPAPSRFAWTPSQRRVLIVILVALFVYLSIRYACNPVYVSDPQPQIPARYHDLADRIDPNNADWQTLAALPGIGEKRAKDIVEYRDRAIRERPGRPPFASERDLLRVRGIGLAMINSMREYLTFPGQPATVPAAGP